MKMRNKHTHEPIVLFLSMNKIMYALLLIFIIEGEDLNAQTWPMPGSVWRYCLTDWSGQPSGYLELGVVGDTILSGKSYKIITYIGQAKEPDEGSEHPMTLYTRYNNDTVYRFVNNREYLYFTYNLNVGDVFTTYRTAGFYNWNDSACSSVLPLKVIEKETVVYEGQILRKYVLQDTLFHYLYEGTYPEVVEYTLVERIGVLNSYPLINSMEPEGEAGGECTLPSDWGSEVLGKYSDNSFEHLFSECEGVGISTVGLGNNTITISPNPTSNFIEVIQPNDIAQLLEIRIFDLAGNLLLNNQINTIRCKIDLSNFKPGSYILTCVPVKTSQTREIFPIIIY